MVDFDIGSATVTDMTSNVDEFSVDSVSTDGPGEQKETTYINSNWAQQLGYFKRISELNRAITALAFWTAGKGYTTESRQTEVQLKRINGYGADNFVGLMQNMIKTMKIGGDAFAQIIRNKETGTLINLKPLDPGVMRIVVNREGIILRYEQVSKIKQPDKRFEINEILHLCNDRIADEIHGTSIIDICEWAILARNEAMTDQKKVVHRNVIPLRVLKVSEDDTTKLKALKTKYEEVINKGEVMIIPDEVMEVIESKAPLQDILPWIRYLENFFYQSVGVPRVIATSEDYTESGGKVGFLTFEPVYTNEQTLLERELWNQLAIKLKFNRPPSLGGDLQRDEAKDAGQQTAMQPSDTTAGAGR